MNELIKIEPSHIGGEAIQTCNARDLHAFLEVKARFNDWIRNRVEDFGFQENQDFITLTRLLVSGGKRKDYYLSLDMAKELATIERNAKGKEARRYFIQCERIAKQVTARPVICYETGRIEAAFCIAEKLASVFKVSKERAAVHALAAIQKDIGMEAESFREMIPSVPVEKTALLNPTEVDKRLSPVISAKTVNQVLMELGFQERLEKG